MIMMMTDSDRVALPAFLPTFLFCFIHLFMPTSTPTGMPLQFVTHHITPDRSSSSILTTCFLRTSHQHLGQANPRRYLPRPFPFSTSAAPLNRSSSISTSFCSQQQPKKTCNQDQFLPSPHLQASMRTRTFCARISMYLLPLAVFISHQKEGSC